HSAAPVTGSALRVDQRAQVIEAIGCDQTSRHQFPECCLHLCFEPAGPTHDISEKRCPALAQEVENLPSSRTEAASLGWIGCRMPWRHPIRLFADEKRDGCNAGGNDPPFSVSRILKRRRMGRKSAPCHCPAQTELVQPLWIVVPQASRQDLPLPGVGWNFESLQL